MKASSARTYVQPAREYCLFLDDSVVVVSVSAVSRGCVTQQLSLWLHCLMLGQHGYNCTMWWYSGMIVRVRCLESCVCVLVYNGGLRVEVACYFEQQSMQAMRDVDRCQCPTLVFIATPFLSNVIPLS